MSGAGAIGDPPEDDVALVGEYVLGLLSPGERLAVEDRFAAEPGMRALNAEWEGAFAPLMDAEPVAPPARVRAAAEGRLFPSARRARRPGRWFLGAGMAAVLAALALVALLPEAGFAPTLRLEAAGAAGAPDGLVLVAGADPARGELHARVEGAAPAPGRAFEIWAIDGDAAPVSLGVAAPGETVVVDRAALGPGLVIAVSDEPAGGSSTGAPTGAVLAAGPLEPI